MQQGTIIFRPGEAKDCEQLAKVKYQVWQSTYQGIYPQEKLDSYDWEAQRESFQRILERKTVQLLVAVEGETIVGYLCWGLSWRERSLGEPQIVLLSVQKEYQGRGIGKALFSLGKKGLREKGYPEGKGVSGIFCVLQQIQLSRPGILPRHGRGCRVHRPG